MNRFAPFALALALIVSLVAVTSRAGAAGQAGTPAAQCPSATAEESQAVVARWYEEVLNAHDPAVLDEILAPDLIHDSGMFPDEPGPRVIIEALLTAFPDVIYSADYVASTDDTVVVRWTATGTHAGEFQGHAPTGKTATWTGINIFTVACGQITSIITELDALGRYDQLGLLPVAPEGTPIATPTASGRPAAG